MAKKTPIDKLDAAIESILNEYVDDIDRKSAECVKKVAQAGARAVKASAQQAVNGTKYASGWKATVTDYRTGAVGTIYNASQPGLAHLLEHGHVTRNGTGRTFPRTPAHSHIAPVEEEIAETFYKDLIKVVQA